MTRLTWLRCLLATVLTAALSAVVIAEMRLNLLGVDDANILFVYSKHLAAGEGLVYNIGSERVEGFSSMLWMLITSVGYLLMQQPTLLFLALNTVLIGCALGYAWQYLEGRQIATQPDNSAVKTSLISLPALLLFAWVFANPSYFIWTVTSLMETGLWSALILGLVILLLRGIEDRNMSRKRLIGFTLLLMLALLSRPESMAWLLYFLAMLLLVLRWLGRSFASLYRDWLIVAMASGGCLAALILFRLNYFGFPLPNTYYAKMTPDKLYDLQFGLLYLRDFVVANKLAIIPILAATAIVLCHAPAVIGIILKPQKQLNKHQLSSFCIASAALTGMVLPVLMGGDIFGAFRFFQPAWPLLILTVLLLPPPEWYSRISRPAVWTISIIAVCVFSFAHSIRWTNLGADPGRVRHLYELTYRGILTGQYVQEVFPVNTAGDLPSIGASAAGGYKMGYPGMVIDTMGLNFTPMAHHSGDKKGERGHASFNKDIFWQYAPDLLEPTLCPRTGEPVNRFDDPGNWVFEIYQRLTTDADFVDRYRFVAIETPQTGGWLCTYIKADLLQTLKQNQQLKIVAVE